MRGDMSALTRDLPGAVTPVNSATVETRVHTIELFSHTPLRGFRTEIEGCLRRRISIKPCRDRTGFVHGYRAIINDPTLAVLPVLQRIVDANTDVFVHRVD